MPLQRLRGFLAKLGGLVRTGVSAVAGAVGRTLERLGGWLSSVSKRLEEEKVTFDFPDAPLRMDAWREIRELRGSPRMKTEFHMVYEVMWYDPLRQQGETWLLTYATDELEDWEFVFEASKESLEGYQEVLGLRLVGFRPVGIRRRAS